MRVGLFEIKFLRLFIYLQEFIRVVLIVIAFLLFYDEQYSSPMSR